VGPGEIGLGGADLGQAEVVEAEVGGKVGLFVSSEPGPGAGDVAPFGEALAPEASFSGVG
jgi:hypothetical protein